MTGVGAKLHAVRRYTLRNGIALVGKCQELLAPPRQNDAPFRQIHTS